jgi:hypothetical protein
MAAGATAGVAGGTSNEEMRRKFGARSPSTPVDAGTGPSRPLLRVQWLAFHGEVSTVSHYVGVTVPKKSGGQ